MIKLTFLITVFNEVKTVRKAINDIINLDVPNKEIIIIDNASSDGSQEIIRDFLNIKTILRNNNLGYGSTVAEGLKIAKGKYIYIHNSDLEYDHTKSIEMISNGKEGLIQVLLTYYSMLAMIGVITGVLKPLWF